MAATPAPIRTERLVKVYGSGDHEVRAVAGLDLEVKHGEFFGLLGPNGAGKSTTIGMLTTMIVPTSGGAFVAGMDARRHPAAVKRRIGVVAQTNTLDRQLTVWENLYYHGRYFGVARLDARQRTDELLEQFALADRSTAMIHELSGGMAQRLMVARALVHKPEILFLDEPTSGIDPQTRINLWRILQDLHDQGQTILLTTHYMEEADTLCQRIAIIDCGSLLALGSPAELKRQYGSQTLITITVDGDAAPLERIAQAAEGARNTERDGATIRVLTERAGPVLTSLVEAARTAGLEVRDVASQPPSLETVFLNLTGRQYRE